MSDNRAIVYVEGGIPVYRASSIGLPLRCLTAARAGNEPLPPPEFLAKAAEAGNRYEAIMKQRLTDNGYIIGDEQDEIELTILQHGEEIALIRGHLDGETVIDPQFPTDRMLEVKSMSDTVYTEWSRHRFERFTTYAWQLSAYMHATGKPALYAVINRDTEETELLPIDTPPVSLIEIESKVQAVEVLNQQNIMPPCSGAKYPCAYSYLCDRSDISYEDMQRIGDDGDAVLAAAVEEYEAIRREEDAIKVRKAAVRDNILAALGDRSKADVGLNRVQYITSTSKKLDQKALRAHLGDDLDQFYTTNEYTQLRVTKRKEME